MYEKHLHLTPTTNVDYFPRSQCASLKERPGYEIALEVFSLAWKPDSTQLVTTHMDCTARVWDIASRASQPIHFLGHRKFVVSSTWSPDGQWIVTGDTQADPLRVWDASTGEQTHELYEHDSWPLSIDWRYDGTALVSSGMDGRVLLWRMSDCEVVGELHPKRTDRNVPFANYATVRFSADGKRIIFADDLGNVWVWHRQPRLLHDSASGVWGTNIAISKVHPDKIALMQDGAIGIWNIETGAFVGKLPEHETIIADELTPDTAQAEYRWSLNMQGRLSAIDWHPNGRDLLKVGGDRYLRLWHGGVPQPLVDTGGAYLNVASWSPDGRYLAVGAGDGAVSVWVRQGT